MSRHLSCLRCGQTMHRIENQKLLLVPSDMLLVTRPKQLLDSAAEVDVYSCPDCGKIEFFLADDHEEGLPQRRCPKCGKQHDFDYPRCPFCKYDYSR